MSTAQADELFTQNKNAEAAELLASANTATPNNAEILWRLAKAHFELSEEKPEDKALRQAQLEKGAQYGEQALAADPNNYGSHKWWALSVSALGQFQDSKEKIGNAVKIRDHAIKATELKPDDAQSFYLLGRWAYTVAGIGWIERQVASALFGTPPTATYDDALGYLNKSIELDATNIRTASYLGDTYYAKKDWAKAKEWYQKALDLPQRNQVDRDYVPDLKSKVSKL
ncbi:hypothetical protein PROFUN_05770 [Planoprotostelium fungivorum]|uniref:Regulator of microtubule dynamics protein 1 n=1 Tax=Planoprotostelium fungivorum TaxID=1890364 RepID=A0A2P6NPX1_9EUKA|nr:hypothetical protein PROFUN_05770 [Planoprotostelium fungivorum]